jgi:hypothetical protein
MIDGAGGDRTITPADLVNGLPLGTPASVVLTHGTGLPISTGVSGLAAGVATFLATPTSANLATALTDETGTGAAVFANSPALAGVPTAPTAAVDTNTTQIATAAMVLGQASAVTPATITNAAAIGTSTRFARADHAHAYENTAWTTFAPAPVAGTATFTVNFARFKTIGKSVFMSLDFTMTAVGTASTSISITLPATPQSGSAMAGRESASNGKGFAFSITAGSTAASGSKADTSQLLVNERMQVSGVFESQ